MNRVPIVLAVVVLAPSAASADDHLDLALPDLPLLESAYHLDRGTMWEDRSNEGYVGWLGVGAGRIDDRGAAVGSAALGAGRHSDTRIALWRSEIRGDTLRGLAGRHRGLFEIRTDYDADEGVGETVTTSFEHGEARALAPLRLGPGVRETADLTSETLIQLGHISDGAFVGVIRGELGGTHWDDAPTIDHEVHRAIALGVGAAPADGELPRGHVDFVRARVELQTITSRTVPTPLDGAQRPIQLAGGDVRSAEIGVGPSAMTLYIDHELLAIIDADIGWSWIETDRIADNAFRMHLATQMKWTHEREDSVRRIGFDLARLPSITPDGQRIAGDWRLELANGMETPRYLIEARGGLSWIVPFAGGPGNAPAVQTLIRYGVQLEAFAKLTRGLEAGVYHASSYEPRTAGDPWMAPRQWRTETGVLVRVRK